MESALHMHPQEQAVTESSQRTSSLSSMTNNSYLSSGQSKLKEKYHMPYERLRFVQRLLRYPYSFTPNWCSCSKKNPSHSDRWAEEGVKDQCVLLKEYSTEIATTAATSPPPSTYSWLTCFNKMNAQLSAYRLELEMERQDKSCRLQKTVCADHNECGVQVSSTHNDTLRDNKSCYRESEQPSEEEESTYKNATMINLISPLSESTLRKSKWESFKEGEDGRPMTAIGHMARKIHSIPPPLTHHKQNTIHKNSSSINSIYINSTKEVIDETHHNIGKDEANDSYADKTNTLHKSRVAGTNLADYMWCLVEENKIGHCKNILNSSISRNNSRKSQTEDKLNAHKSTSSYSTEIDLTSAEEILKSENEHDDVYLFVNTSNSSVKAPEGHSQSSENEPFISLNLPELKHCIAAITPSITALTTNTDDDTETDTTPTGRQLFHNSSDKGYSHSHQLVYSVRERQLGDNAISTFSLTSRPQTPSTQQIQEGKEIHSDKTELFCVEPVSEEEHLHWQSECVHEQPLEKEKKQEEEEEQEQLRMEKHESNEYLGARELTASPKENAICIDMTKESNDTNAMNVINEINTFNHVNEVALAERKENVLTTPNIQTPSNSMVPLCSPPACDSTGLRETSPEQDIVVSSNDVRVNIPDKTNSNEALQNNLELLWNDKKTKDNKTITTSKHDKIKRADVHDSVHHNDVISNINKNKEECQETQDARVDVVNAVLNVKKGIAEIPHNNICKNDVARPQMHNSRLNVASSTDTRCFVQPKETNSVWTSDTDSGTNRPEHSTIMPPSPPLTPTTNTFTEPELPHELPQEKSTQEPRWVSGELYRGGTAIRRVNSLELLQTNHHVGSSSMIAKLHNWVRTLDSENNNQNKEHNESLQLPSSTTPTAVNDKCEVGRRPSSCSNSNCNHRQYNNRNRLLFSRLPSKFHTIELKS